MARKQEVFGVTVEGDITGLKKAMNDAVKVFNSTERSLKNVNKALELDPTDEKMLEKQRELYKKAIEENQNALKELKKVRNEIVNDPNFIKGVTDMGEKFTSVDKKVKELTSEQKKLKKELKELSSTNIVKLNEKFKKLSETAKESKESIEKIKKSLENVNKQIKLDPTNLDLYTQRTKLLNDELVATESAIRKIKEKQAEINNSPGFFSGNFKSREHIKQMTEYSLVLAELEERAKELRNELSVQLSPAMSAFVNVVDKLGKKMQALSDSTRMLSRAFSAIGIASIKASMDYESSIANIKRVVSDLSDDTISGLKDIAVETGNAFSDIADYATIGGALGLAEKELSQFSRTMIDLNTATGGVFAGEEGAKGIAVFLKQLNLGIDQAQNFGSAIAVIGDKYADIGDETVNVATRLTGLNSIIKTNQYELIGLAGVMADLGLATDSNANGINRAFLQIDKIIGGGVKNSTEKLEEMASVAGMTSKQFREAWGKNAVDAFLRFTDGLKSSVFNEINDALSKSSTEVQKYADVLGLSAEQFERLWGQDSHKVFEDYVNALGELGDEGVVASKVLGDLGISSVNTAQTLLRLAGNGNEVRKAIELTEQAWKENTALTEKSGIIYDTTANKLKGLWEAVKQLGDSLGREVLPYVKDFTDMTTDLVKDFSRLSPTAKQLIVRFTALGASISPVSKGFAFFLNGLPKLIGFLSGPGGIIALTATLASILPVLGREHSLTDYIEAMKGVKEESQKLNESLLESISNADQIYKQKELEISQYEREAGVIDDLLAKLNDEKLSYEERKRIKEEVKKYVDDLNEALGTEAFKFDTVSGKIYENGEACDTVKGKFQELTAEIKKETWLNAHKGVLEEAYANLETSTDRMDEATETYLANAEKIPENIRGMLEGFQGTFEEFKRILDDNKIEFDEDQMLTWFNTWESYRSAIQETQTLIDNANSVIDNYMLVADANVETLDGRISDATEAIKIMQEGVSESDVSLEKLVNKRNTYYQTLTDEQTVNDELLTKYDEQITKLKTQMDYEADKYGWATKTKEQVQTYIDINESWQPQPKIQYIDVVYRGLRSDLGGISLGGGSQSRSGGFGSDSFGFGDLLKSTLQSVRNSMGNVYRSGGFRSGGITVNNTFTVNSNNVGRQDVKNWSSWIIDDLNEALGKQM